MITGRNTKRVYLIVAAVIIIIAAFWLIVPRILGKKIRHYKQLFFECDGQVLYNAEFDTDITVPFYFYDETDLSEMADPNNFQKVKVYFSNGEEVEATNCMIEDCSDSANVGKRYSYKKVSITFPVTKECDIVACSFEYIDKTEKFSIGNLKLRTYEAGMYLNDYKFYVELYDTLQRDNKKDAIANSPCNLLMLDVLFGQDGDDVSIDQLDLGSDIIFADLSKIQYFGSGSIDLERVNNNSDFHQDWTIDDISKEDSTVLIEKSDNEVESVYYAMPLAVTDEYEEKPRNYYLNPLVYITEKDGTQHIWGCTTSPYVSMPLILEDTAVEQLKEMIEEDGQ